MKVTPQSIKDAEFKVKLRGYDQAEVKAYLEGIGEEHLKLIEQLEKREESIQSLSLSNNKLQEESRSLEKDIGDAHRTVDIIKNDCRQEKEQCEKQKQELQTLRKTVGELEGEKQTIVTRLGRADALIKQLRVVIAEEQSSKKKLLQHIHLLEQQNKKVQNQENDLKTTLATAHKFSEKIIEESEQQASEVISQARLEIEKFRRETQEELAFFPAEIQRMKQEHDKVKEQLRAIVNGYLESFDNTLETDDIGLKEEPGVVLQEMDGCERKQDGPECQAAVEKPGRYEKAHKAGDGLTQQPYVAMDELDGQDELFQSIHIPDEKVFENDSLDEISRNIFLPLDLEDE